MRASSTHRTAQARTRSDHTEWMLAGNAGRLAGLSAVCSLLIAICCAHLLSLMPTASPRWRETAGRAGSVAMERAGGAVCNSDCDGTVWLRVASEGTVDRGSFQKTQHVANQAAAGHARSPLGARQERARSISACRFCAGVRGPGAEAPAQHTSRTGALAHWLQRPQPTAVRGRPWQPIPARGSARRSGIEAIRVCSSFANRSEQAPPSGALAGADLRARLPRAC